MSRMITNIVFTRNRPLQLDAYLESLYRHFGTEYIQTYVIYKVELFSEEYESLFEKYPDCIVIREKDFHSDCVKLINQMESKYILFGVDDVVYFDSVDFDVIDKTFDDYNEDIFGFALRFSPAFLKDGGDIIVNIDVAGQEVHRLNWKNGQTPYSRYPFELCSTIYTTALVKKIICNAMNNKRLIRTLFSPGSFLIKTLGKVIPTRSILKSFGYFFNPNTLESWNCRWCQNHDDELPSFFYFQKLCASAIQVNMVNATTRKTFDGPNEYTVEALAEKYRQGYRLDINFIDENKPTGIHCGSGCFRLEKNR